MKILNTYMKNSEYKDSMFFQYTGKDLDALWLEYLLYRKENS